MVRRVHGEKTKWGPRSAGVKGQHRRLLVGPSRLDGKVGKKWVRGSSGMNRL